MGMAVGTTLDRSSKCQKRMLIAALLWLCGYLQRKLQMEPSCSSRQSILQHNAMAGKGRVIKGGGKVMVGCGEGKGAQTVLVTRFPIYQPYPVI